MALNSFADYLKERHVSIRGFKYLMLEENAKDFLKDIGSYR